MDQVTLHMNDNIFVEGYSNNEIVAYGSITGEIKQDYECVIDIVSTVFTCGWNGDIKMWQ